MPGWNFAEVWEFHAAHIPNAPAQIWGDQRWTWSDFSRRADGVAASLLAAGVVEQDKVALCLYNRPEYLEATFATFKAGLVPVNTNYRYSPEELFYIWDNADAAAVVFEGTFVDRIDAIRHRLGGVKLFLHIDDGTEDCPAWAVPYELAAASAPNGPTIAPWGRSGDHIFMLYTGGTTGRPKGVMWRQDDLFSLLDAANRRSLPPEPGWDQLAARTTGPGPINLPAAPLMHGTGGHNALTNLSLGGCIVTAVGRSFSPLEILDLIQEHRVQSITLVGDAFAAPLLRALDAEPGRWDISSLRVIVSSGVMWSAATKQGLLAHNDRLILMDLLGSSEAIGMAANRTTAGAGESTGSFKATTMVLISEDGRLIEPGSGEQGLAAQPGRLPLGYYKDETKSLATFRVVDGVRYAVPGDWAEIDADGTIRLLGRGSQCINTGGEKVYPEEVEEALKTHPSVVDAAVVGVPDERFGQAICALVQVADSEQPPSAPDLISHVKTHLSSFKAPKQILIVADIGRAANGKLDYPGLTRLAKDRLGLA